MRVLEPTRAEPGCIAVRLFESTRGPLTFSIHAEWTDDAAFDTHTTYPHMTQFLAVIDDLVTHQVKALRTREIA